MKIFLLILICSSPSLAATSQDVSEVYSQIVVKNNIQRAPSIYFDSSKKPLVYVTESQIVISAGALSLFNTSEMAFAVGHELAHFLLGHPSSTPEREFAADALGFKLASKAGFNGCSLFDKLVQRATDSHPHPQLRKKRLGC